MSLKDTAPNIRDKQFIRWRSTGMAFEHREGDYTQPNKTLASGQLLKTKEGNVGKRGYWGDILMSPYLSFGVETENEALYTKRNEQYVKTASDVSLYNVMAMMAEAESGTPFQAEVDLDTPELLKAVTMEEPKGVGLPLDELISIHVLPLGAPDDFKKKAKYKELFDLVYLSNSAAQHLEESLVHCLAADGRVVCETARHLHVLKEEQKQTFIDTLKTKATDAGLRLATATTSTQEYIIFHNHTA
eukprot:m.8558 g.8558  ORF g.8558 m.8558 type:complete len:245 (+) comp9217_c0_seq1:104-838(+)